MDSPWEPRLTVKNTFIEFEEEDSPGRLLASALHWDGAQTCTARLGEAADDVAPFFPPAAPLPSASRGTVDDASTTVPSSPEAPGTPRLGSPGAPRSRVMLQVPLQVEAGLLPVVQEVRSATFDAATGRLSLDLQVLLRPAPATASPATASLTEALPVPAAQTGARGRA